LLHQIGTHLDISLSDVPVIGDSLRDLEAAQSVGARPILVRTGNGRKTEESLPAGLSTIEVYDNLAGAAFALLSE
jgi:D-glycero-D-manno-heptose 1,7-bisphosphate phosphatase